MPKPLSERVREAANEGDPPATDGFVEHWTRRVGRHEPTRIGSVVMHGHLTIGRPEQFYAPELGVVAVSTGEFLSDTEESRLVGSYVESTEGQVREDFQTIQEKESTILALGHPPDGEEEEDADWVAGFLAYVEPKDRLVGPEHQEKGTSEFCSEFLERGGEYLVGSPTTALAAQFAIATKLIYHNNQ